MSIIADPRARAARAVEKRRILLRFLRDEIFTTMATAASAIGVGERAARAMIARLEAAGLVRRWPLVLLAGMPPVSVVGITAQGQIAAFDPERGETLVDRCFEPSRHRLANLQHRLDVQRLRIEAARSGAATQWINGDRIKVAPGAARPDAVCLTPAGTRVAVECERTIKAPRRYAGIVSAHLTAIHQHRWSRVVWACPDDSTAARVRALVWRINSARIAGVETRLDPEHRAALSFCTYDHFTENLE